jgi:beta-lactamase regulating signal transducer with metallopeptidase domain
MEYAGSLWDTGRLWQNGLAAVPVALVVAAICRWAPCRPATRHLLWLVVLTVLLAPHNWLGSRVGSLASAGANWMKSRAEELASASAAQLAGEVAQTRPEPSGPDSVRPTQRPAEAKAAPDRFVAGAAVGAQRPALVQELKPDPTAASSPPPTNRRTAVPDSGPNAVPGPGPGSRSDLLRSQSSPGPRNPTDVPPLALRGAVRADSLSAPAGSNAGTVERPVGGTTPRLTAESNAVPESALESDKSVAPASVGVWGSKLLALRDAVVAVPPIPSAIWAGGVAALVAASGIRTLMQRRALSRAEQAPPEVRRMVASTAATLGLSRPPEIWMVADRISPMVWCGFKRRLLLPKELWAELDEISRNAVVMHELAHLKRKDHWTCWAELAACAIYWWHPVAWWMRRRLREEADHCCDAWVTALFPRERRLYAQALLETRKYISHSRWSEPAVGLSASAGGAKRFARRLTMVMTQRNKPGGSWAGVALAAVLAGCGLAAGPLWACPPEEQDGKQKVRTARVAPRPAVAPAPARTPTPPAAPAAPRALIAPAPMAVLPALADEPPEDASTFERHMAIRGLSTTPTSDLEALLKSAGDRLEMLDDRLDVLRDLLQAVDEPTAVSEPIDMGEEECPEPCEGLPSEGRGEAFSSSPDGRALVLIVGDDGQVQVYRLADHLTADIVAMLDEADGPVVVQPGGRVAINGADVERLVAGREAERAARARASVEAIRAAARDRSNTMAEVYRRQAEAYERAAQQTSARADELRVRAESLEQQARAMSDSAATMPRREQRQIEAEVERFERQSEAMREAAEEMAEQAEELLDQAREAVEEASHAAEHADIEAEEAVSDLFEDDEAEALSVYALYEREAAAAAAEAEAAEAECEKAAQECEAAAAECEAAAEECEAKDSESHEP